MTNGFKKYVGPVVVMLLVICAALMYVAKTDIEDFREEQLKLAGSASRNARFLLQLYIAELHRSVDLFIHNNRHSLQALRNSETSQRAYTEMNLQLYRQLADAVAFTLADAKGELLLSDDTGIVGDACRENIRLSASDTAGVSAPLRIHADKNAGHFDILTPVSINGEQSILLVAFTTHRIAQYLELLQPPGHRLFLVKTGTERQIEVAASESRQHELTAAKSSRVMFSEHVDATAWDVTDVIDFELLQREKWHIIRLTLFLLAAFLAGGIASIVIIKCHKQMNRGVTNELEPYRRELEEQIRNRTSALEAANERLQHLSLSDGLTGIANRRHFDHVLARELRRALRQSMPLSLLLIDIDYFKKYNDAVGHLAGDDALKKIAHTIQNEFKRGADLAARYGGEEFAVILPGATGKEAFKQAERIRQLVDRLNIKHPDTDIADHITISVGVTSLGADQYKTTDELIDEADTALYRSKSDGRNRSSAFQV